MKLGRAMGAGIAGGIVVVTAIAAAGWATDTDADLCALAGVILTGRQDGIGWLAGAAAQLLLALVFGIMYAAIFEFATRRSGPLTGFAIAVPHAIAAGLAIGFVPVSRLIDVGILPPGAFMEYRGAWVVATFVLAHIAFGVLVGSLYGRIQHDPPAAYRWQDITLHS
jgi:uncharacterized membrane protein